MYIFPTKAISISKFYVETPMFSDWFEVSPQGIYVWIYIPMYLHTKILAIRWRTNNYNCHMWHVDVCFCGMWIISISEKCRVEVETAISAVCMCSNCQSSKCVWVHVRVWLEIWWGESANELGINIHQQYKCLKQT